MLAFDYGEKRMGVALGDTKAVTAKALTTLRVTRGLPNQQQLARLFSEYLPVIAVVGSPHSGGETNTNVVKVQRAANRFAIWLQKHWHIEIAIVDESYTSVVTPIGHNTETTIQKRIAKNHTISNKSTDAQAACHILLQWYNEQNKAVIR